MTGHAKQMVTVEVGSLGMAEPDSSSTSADQIVKDFQKRLPKPLKDLAGAETTFDGKSLTIKIPSQGKTTAVFFPLEYPGVTYGDATIKKEALKTRIAHVVVVQEIEDFAGQRQLRFLEEKCLA